jgi:hypothetical protein
MPCLLVLEDRTLPSTFTVLNNADNGDGSLRAVIADAQSGDQIAFDHSLQGQTITLTTGELAIAKSLDIEGLGADQLAVSGNHQSRVFNISGGVTVTIAGLTITAGLVAPGNADALGGGIVSSGADVTLNEVVLQNNVAQGGDAPNRTAPGYSAFGAGIYSAGGALTIAGTTIADNQATGGRGGDYSGDQHAGDGGFARGGGIFATGGSLDISDSTIASNRATGGRGGDGSFSISGSYGSHNGGSGGTGQGGGLYVNGGSLTVTSSAVASNLGTGGSGGAFGLEGFGGGGGLYNISISPVTISNSTLAGNSARNGAGGGISNYTGTLTISNSTLSGNTASSGGGINNSSGTLTISNSTLSGNIASSGGGINNGGVLTVTNSTLSGNSAVRFGGGIDNFVVLTVSNSTLFGNSALGQNAEGGGIHDWGGTVTISNSTLSGNTAFVGGGIYKLAPRSLTLTSVTLTANRANNSGGGLAVVLSAPVVLHSTLIAGNFRGATGTTRSDVGGHLDPGGDYNLIGDGTGMTGLNNGVNGNLIGSASAPIDPLLDSLRYNGGPTQTMALLPGSPALNAGNPNQLGVPDQRGVGRSGGVNIGAYQASASAFVLDSPPTVTAGVPFDVTVTAVDPFGQVAVGYSGTVTFSTTDPGPGVVLPAEYTFTADDGGTHIFTNTGVGETTLRTPGDQLLTVTDTADATITGTATVTVVPRGSALALGGSPRPFGLETTRAITPVQNAKSSSANAAVERLFAALAEDESTFRWLWWEDKEPSDPTLL